MEGSVPVMGWPLGFVILGAAKNDNWKQKGKNVIWLLPQVAILHRIAKSGKVGPA